MVAAWRAPRRFRAAGRPPEGALPGVWAPARATIPVSCAGRRRSPPPAPAVSNLPSHTLQAAAVVQRGDLLPDALVRDLVGARLAQCAAVGTAAVLDGYPRTAAQAAHLLTVADVRLALNLTLREQVLIDKCLGRRVCGECGAGYNVADIQLPATNGLPAVTMPPMPPPPECESHMEVRADDNPSTVARRLEVYRREAAPVEAVFRGAGVLVDFPVTGGVGQTMPRLLDALATAKADVRAAA